MLKRKIVYIDEEKCDGCGLCVPSCEEGAIQIVGGKARLASDAYCDGLGACLGHCPRGAITVVEREADPFDKDLVRARARGAPAPLLPMLSGGGGGACPGAAARRLQPSSPLRASAGAGRDGAPPCSGLANWPIQLSLAPPEAPLLDHADLLLVADCVPFAYRGFHERFLDGRPVLIGCPKLDDSRFYVEKLAQILRVACVRRLTVAHMEVPCCTGLLRVAEAAIAASGLDIPLESQVITLQGEVAPVSESAKVVANESTLRNDE